VAPAFNYTIPLMVNSFLWCYLVVVSGFLGMLTLSLDIHKSLKALAVYLFAACFISQSPYLSFNAYLLVSATFYFYWLSKKCDFSVVTKFIEAAFWLQLILTVMQFFGKDTLLNFDRPESVFLGTVMQYMRFASVLAVMAPFLLLKSKWYILPILALCLLSRSSTFALSLALGCLTWFFLTAKKEKWDIRAVTVWFLLFVGAYAVYDWGSIRGAILPENGGRLISWLVILKTWCLDTSQSFLVDPWGITGPFNWQWFLFGHGMDTFLPLFPVYKHDFNPFPQAHNSYLQLLWEIGLVGFWLIAAYVSFLIFRLYKKHKYELISGAVMIGVNCFFAFPDRMTQTAPLIVAYLALCEQSIKPKVDQHGI
jgi:hypothetical protein